MRLGPQPQVFFSKLSKRRLLRGRLGQRIALLSGVAENVIGCRLKILNEAHPDRFSLFNQPDAVDPHLNLRKENQ
jgi:hypothetical protein